MSKWVLAFLCFASVRAFASSADSGRCPWKLPFTIKVHAIGNLHNYSTNPPTNQGVVTDTLNFEFGPDSSDCSITNDTLRSYSAFNDTSFSSILYVDDQFTIVFEHGKDFIFSLDWTRTQYDGSLHGGVSAQTFLRISNFKIFSLSFDDTSIFTSDSSFCDHTISIVDSDQAYSQNDTQVYYFTATSADLSGIFRPTHYTCAASVSEPAQTSESLTVATSNDGLHCTFASSDNPRTLEVYSILGVRAASSTISAGAAQGIALHLSPGFYFVRLGNQIAKTIIP
jgi:hypothetical protein